MSDQETPKPTHNEPTMNRHQRRAQKAMLKKAMKQATKSGGLRRAKEEDLPVALDEAVPLDPAEGTVTQTFPLEGTKDAPSQA